MAGELINVLQQSSLLRNLPLSALGPLSETASVSQHPAGSVVFEADAADDTLYVVRSGLVDLWTTVGGERLATLRPGTAFGELAAFDAQPRPVAASARTDCELVGVRRAALVEVFERDPGALLATVSNMAGALTEARDEVAVVNRFVEDHVRDRTEQVREMQMEIIHRLASAAEFRSSGGSPQIYRMGRYCQVLAEGAGLDDAAAEELLLAAPMHDVGKMGVPDSVLLKPGALDDEEWRVMQAHTTMGAQILGGSRSRMIQLAEQIALEHHEKWDGTGYPHGLRGTDISLEARISTVADVFDALTSERPYKEPWPFDKALGLIDNARGTTFDPELVDVFLAEEDRVHRIHVASLEGTLQPPSWQPRPIEPLPERAATTDASD